MNFETLFVNPNGRTARAEYVPALVAVLAVIAFYAFVVTGRTAQFCMLVLLYPACVLIARRVRDMGYSAWLVLVPLLPLLATFARVLKYVSFGDPVDSAVYWIALALSAAFALWGCAKQ